MNVESSFVDEALWPCGSSSNSEDFELDSRLASDTDTDTGLVDDVEMAPLGLERRGPSRVAIAGLDVVDAVGSPDFGCFITDDSELFTSGLSLQDVNGGLLVSKAVAVAVKPLGVGFESQKVVLLASKLCDSFNFG